MHWKEKTALAVTSCLNLINRSTLKGPTVTDGEQPHSVTLSYAWPHRNRLHCKCGGGQRKRESQDETMKWRKRQHEFGLDWEVIQENCGFKTARCKEHSYQKGSFSHCKVYYSLLTPQTLACRATLIRRFSN